MPRNSRPNRFKTTNPPGRSKGRCLGRMVRGPRLRGREWIDRRGMYAMFAASIAPVAGGMGALDRGGPTPDDLGGWMDRTRESGRATGRRQAFSGRSASQPRSPFERAVRSSGSRLHPGLGSPGRRFGTGTIARSISDQVDCTPRDRGFRTGTGRRRPSWHALARHGRGAANMPARHRLALCPRSSACFT